jgi:hypothetical protein
LHPEINFCLAGRFVSLPQGKGLPVTPLNPNLSDEPVKTENAVALKQSNFFCLKGRKTRAFFIQKT